MSVNPGTGGVGAIRGAGVAEGRRSEATEAQTPCCALCLPRVVGTDLANEGKSAISAKNTLVEIPSTPMYVDDVPRTRPSCYLLSLVALCSQNM